MFMFIQVIEYKPQDRIQDIVQNISHSIEYKPQDRIQAIEHVKVEFGCDYIIMEK